MTSQTPPAPEPAVLLTPEQCAAWIGIKKPTLLRMVREGRVPVVRLNERVLRFHAPTILDRLNRSSYQTMKPKRNRRVPSC